MCNFQESARSSQSYWLSIVAPLSLIAESASLVSPSGCSSLHSSPLSASAERAYYKICLGSTREPTEMRPVWHFISPVDYRHDGKRQKKKKASSHPRKICNGPSLARRLTLGGWNAASLHTREARFLGLFSRGWEGLCFCKTRRSALFWTPALSVDAPDWISHT